MVCLLLEYLSTDDYINITCGTVFELTGTIYVGKFRIKANRIASFYLIRVNQCWFSFMTLSFIISGLNDWYTRCLNDLLLIAIVCTFALMSSLTTPLVMKAETL